MKYFTSELWHNINNADKLVRDNADKQLIENTEKYQRYFETIKHRIPNHVIKMLKDNRNFHDYLFNRISFTRYNENKYSCELEICNGENCILIKMKDIKSVKIDIETFYYCILGRLAWGYHEFSISDSNSIRLSILCDIENELSFEFKKMTMETRDGLREP